MCPDCKGTGRCLVCLEGITEEGAECLKCEETGECLTCQEINFSNLSVFSAASDSKEESKSSNQGDQQ